MKKLDHGSTLMVFIGFEECSNAYRVYNPAAKRVHVDHTWCSTKTPSGTGARRKEHR
jgi:hypothetical protein